MVYPGAGPSHIIRSVSVISDRPISSPGFNGATALQQVLSNLPRQHPFHPVHSDLHRLLDAPTSHEISGLQGVHEAKLFSLAEETDPDLFYSDLFAMAQNAETQDPVLAQGCYLALASSFSEETEVPQEIVTGAQRRIQVLSGGGSLGEQLEHLSPQILEAALAPEGLLGMAAGGLAFRGIRSGTFVALNAFPRATWWNRGLMARALPSLTGFLAEAPIFTLTTHSLKSAWSPHGTAAAHNLSDQILSGYIMLGALRSFGSVFQRLSSTQVLGQNTFARFSRVALPQAGMALGLMVSQGVEIATGRRELGPWQGHFAEVLGTLFQFHVAGRLLPQVMGPGYRRLERQLDTPWQMELSGRNISNFFKSNLPNLSHWVAGTYRPRLAGATGPEIPPTWVAMANHEGGRGAQLPLVLTSPSLPEPGRRPRSTPTPPPAATSSTQILPNGRGLLPQGGPQMEMLPVTEGAPLGPQDVVLVQQIAGRLRSQLSTNPQSTLHSLKPVLVELARQQGLAFDVFLGRSLGQANAIEIEAALSLIRNPRQPGTWMPEHDIAWITRHDLKGGIPRLGTLAQDIGNVGTRARQGLLQMALRHRSEVYPAVEAMLNSTQTLVLWNGLNLATRISHRGMIPLLRNHAFGSNPMAHRMAREALMTLNDQALAPHLRKIIDNPRGDWSEKAWAAYGLGRLGHLSEASGILSSFIQSSRAQTRFEAARGLIRLNLNGTIPSTLEMIKDMQGRELITLTQDCLAAGYRNHAEYILQKALELPENGIHVQALELIATHQLQNLSTTVAGIRNSQYPNNRWAATRAELAMAAARGDRNSLWEFLEYGEAPGKNEPAHFRMSRELAQEQIQIAAAKYLAELPLLPLEQEILVRQLQQRLSSAAEGATQLAAAQILAGPLQNPQGRLTLMRLLNHSDPEIRAQAAHSLGEVAPGWDTQILDQARRFRFILSEQGLRFDAHAGE